MSESIAMTEIVNDNGKRPLVSLDLDESAAESHQRVKFNVGGCVYEITRDILMKEPDTMLARSASKVWQNDPNKEIFLNGDRERFRYVLDYLRNGEVDLPLTIPKPALLKDLDYYGFQNIDESRLKPYGCGPDIGAIIRQAEKNLDERLDGIDTEIESLKAVRYSHIVAYHCFLRFWHHVCCPA